MELKDLILQTLDEVTTDANMDSSVESDAESSAESADSGAGGGAESVKFGVDSSAVAKGAPNATNAENPSALNAGNANQLASASQNASISQSTQNAQNNAVAKAQNLAESKEPNIKEQGAQELSTKESSTKPARSRLPKTSIESSPTKNGKIIPPNTAGYQLDSKHIEFLENLREKLLVLFEGLKMPELQDQQAKLDLVVNFLQYELCLLDEFLHKS
ncbi:hypothetical protein BKN38_08180 [Helicobacter sp. CLO-3]|uniref:CiaD-like domain-containing protein n=1 Tax=unclassified Helicobacter TaxID=2593540 RepID=UPI0008048931|nr:MULTISPECIES: hypothetical protein [unclassified Helicobacter]OBV28756.1 hypothetical protein BA723_08190 [Helicobacter sp. CLO-3]OHU81861.1 hypothetical protein BKN38_08180 [Helicobacter sp. CLO-3]